MTKPDVYCGHYVAADADVKRALDRARPLINAGWGQGALAYDKRGEICAGSHPDATRWSLLGAIDCAMYGGLNLPTFSNERRVVDNVTRGIQVWIARYLEITMPPGTYGHVWAIEKWNDTRRDKAEVIAGIDSMLESLA